MKRRRTALGERHNRLGAHLFGNVHRRAGHRMGDFARMAHRVFVHTHQRILFFFRRRANQRHLAHGFKRIRAHCRFGGTHHRVCAVQHRVRHVAHFGAGGHGIGNHGFHHLRGGDAETAQFARALNHAFLQRRHGGIAHFHRQIAARHHNAVGCFNNFVQIFNRFNALNFGYQARLNRQAQFFALFGNGAAGDVHVFGVFHKAHCQIVAADFHRRFQIAEIFFGERARR